MELMRHSHMRLTAKVYTGAGMLPLSKTVLNLPELDYPQIAPSPMVSRTVPNLKNGVNSKPVDAEILDSPSPILSLAANVKMVRDAGFEPATSCV